MKKTHTTAAVLFLVIGGVCFGVPPRYECQWESGGWNKLMGGSSLETISQIVSKRPESFDARFSPAGSSTGTETGGSIGFMAACNGTGLLLAVRMEDEDVEWLSFVLQAVEAPTTAIPPPYKLKLGMRRPADDQTLVPFNVPLHNSERRLRYEYPVEEILSFSPRLSRPRLSRSVSVCHFPLENGGRWVSCFLPWGSIPEFMAGADGITREWRLGIACGGESGVQTWGGVEDGCAGGILRLPKFSESQLADARRQWMILVGNPGERYNQAVNDIRSAWIHAGRNAFFGDKAVSASSWEKGSSNGDKVFYEQIVEPLIAGNAELAKAFTRPSATVAEPTVLSMNPVRRQDHLKAMGRLIGVVDEVETARREFLMDRLFGRPLPELDDASNDAGSATEPEIRLDLEFRRPVDLDSLLEGPAL